MSEQEQSFEELLKEEETAKIYKGALVTGKVIFVKEDEIQLNINYKKDGILPKRLYTDDESINLLDEVHEGDELTVKVVNTKDDSGNVLVSYKDQIKLKLVEELRAPFENQEVLTGVVEKANKGLVVNCQGAQVFIPASLVNTRFEKNLDKYVGQEVEFILIEFEPAKRRIIGNRKQILEKKAKEVKDAFFASIQAGQVVTGKIKNITAFGAFIDLGGVDGLLHNTEMTWGTVRDAKSIYKVGDEVEAYIKEIDVEKGKVALSRRFPDTNPWTEDGPYSLGKVVTGKIVRFAKFGAFVELEPGIDGLLHISEIAYERTEKAEDVLKKGQEVEVKVIDYKIEDKKISLSIKALLPEPETTEVYKDTEEAPTEAPVEAPVEEPVVEEAPVEAPAEEPVVEEAPVEAPAEEPVVEEAPVEEAAETPAE